jgi:hypothetical protein
MHDLSKEDLNSSVWDSPEFISSRKGDVGFSDKGVNTLCILFGRPSQEAFEPIPSK